jgi:hypothetical protein
MALSVGAGAPVIRVIRVGPRRFPSWRQQRYEASLPVTNRGVETCPLWSATGHQSANQLGHPFTASGPGSPRPSSVVPGRRRDPYDRVAEARPGHRVVVDVAMGLDDRPHFANKFTISRNKFTVHL